MAISFMGVGAYAESQTSASNVTYNWPAGYTPLAGDLALIFQTGYSNNSAALVNTSSGYTRFINQHWFWTTNTNLMAQVSYKVLTGTESAPVCNTSSNTSSGNGGTPTGYAGGFVAIYRNTSSTLPEAESPSSDDGTTNVRSTATGTPTAPNSVTTLMPDSRVFTMACTTQDSSPNLGTANGFTRRIVSNSTVQQGSIAYADYTKTLPGSVTMPLWTGSSAVWIFLTFSIAVSSSGFTYIGIYNPID
jgi:hypothetical protein